MKKRIVKTLTLMIYFWGCIWYDKKYLKGVNFNRSCFSIGWKWILRYWFGQKIIGYARDVPFPIPRGTTIVNPKNIIFDNNDMNNFHSNGCFYQATKGKIVIGSGTQIAPNCGLVTTNHDIYNIKKHAKGKNVIIGKDCWLGMNAILLPGVELGDHTIVGAGSIVTKSFLDGNCVICGNPAKIIKYLDKEKINEI